MGKKTTVEKEVREAVRNYLQELIGDRSGAGKGMALTANDLMTAARSAGQKGKNHKGTKQNNSIYHLPIDQLINDLIFICTEPCTSLSNQNVVEVLRVGVKDPLSSD